MKSKKVLVAVVTLVILTLAGIFVLMNNKNSGIKYVTGYEDFDGWIYSCSKPIKAKDQGATYGNGDPSFTPVNKSEAAKYCQKNGIE